MRCLPSTRRLALASFGFIPAIALLAACGSNSTSPRAQPTADTIGVNEGNAVVLEAYSAGTDTSYYNNSAISDGDYAEAQITNATNYDDYREFVEFPLPALRGRGVVDSARFLAYSCDNENGFGGLHAGPAPRASGHAVGARRRAGTASRIVRDMKLADSASLFLDHMGWGGSIDGGSFWGEALATDIGTLVPGTDDSNGWKSVSVSAAVASDYAAHRANSQFRLRMNDAGWPAINAFIGFFGEDCNDELGIGGPMSLIVWSH